MKLTCKESEILLDTGSPIIEFPKSSTRKLSLLLSAELTTKFRELFKKMSEVFESQKTAKVKYGDIEKQLTGTLSRRENFAPPLCLLLFDAQKFDARTNQLTALETFHKSAQGIKTQLYTNHFILFQDNKIINGVKVEKTSKPGFQVVQQKSNLILAHLLEPVFRKHFCLQKGRHMEKLGKLPEKTII